MHIPDRLALTPVKIQRWCCCE